MANLDSITSPHQIDFAAQRRDRLQREAEIFRLAENLKSKSQTPPTRRYTRRGDR